MATCKRHQKNLEQNLQAAAQQAATTLEEQAKVLQSFVGQLRTAMNRVSDAQTESSLLQLTGAEVIAQEPDEATEAQKDAQATIEDALTQAEAVATAVVAEVDDGADIAATYIGFLNLTIRETRDKMLLLTNETLNSTLPEETINATAQTITELLQNANQMISGEYDLKEAEKYVERGGAALMSAPLWFMCSFLCLAWQ